MSNKLLYDEILNSIEQHEVDRSIDLTEFKNEHFYKTVAKMCYEESRRVAQKRHDVKASDFVSEMTFLALDARGALR